MQRPPARVPDSFGASWSSACKCGPCSTVAQSGLGLSWNAFDGRQLDIEPIRRCRVRFRGYSGKLLRTLMLSGFDGHWREAINASLGSTRTGAYGLEGPMVSR